MGQTQKQDQVAAGLPGFFGTWLEALVSPSRLYARPIDGRSRWSPVLHALVLIVFVALLEGFWALIDADRHGLRFARVIIRSGLLLIVAPLFFQLAMLVLAIVAHLLLRILRGKRKAFSETLQVFSFSQAPLVFYPVPVVGPLVAVVWFWILMVRGLLLAQRTRWWKAIVVGLVIAGGALLIFLHQGGTHMAAASMVPGIEAGDKVWIDPYSLSFSDPERGQVLAFYVVAEKSELESLWIKRVVALGGDTVEVKAGRLLLNGQPVPLQPSDAECFYAQQVSGDGDQVTPCDTWLETLGDRTYPVAIAIDSARGEAPPDFPLTRVPEGTVFMLGDNRDYSKDSRSFGPIPLRRLLGPVRLVLWSAGPEGTRFGRILSPVR